MQRITVNALVFHEQGMWVAQCLEYDLVSCAETLEELPGELLRQLRAVEAIDRAAGPPPFSAFKPAPAEHWALFERVKRSKPITSPKKLVDRVREALDMGASVDARLFIASKAAA